MSSVFFGENSDVTEGISVITEMLENLTAAIGGDDDEGLTHHFTDSGTAYELVYADVPTETGGRVEIEVHSSYDDNHQTDRIVCSFSDAADSDITFDVSCTREGEEINVYDSMNYVGNVIASALNNVSVSKVA